MKVLLPGQTCQAGCCPQLTWGRFLYTWATIVLAGAATLAVIIAVLATASLAVGNAMQGDARAAHEATERVEVVEKTRA